MDLKACSSKGVKSVADCAIESALLLHMPMYSVRGDESVLEEGKKTNLRRSMSYLRRVVRQVSRKSEKSGKRTERKNCSGAYWSFGPKGLAV